MNENLSRNGNVAMGLILRELCLISISIMLNRHKSYV